MWRVCARVRASFVWGCVCARMCFGVDKDVKCVDVRARVCMHAGICTQVCVQAGVHASIAVLRTSPVSTYVASLAGSRSIFEAHRDQ